MTVSSSSIVLLKHRHKLISLDGREKETGMLLFVFCILSVLRNVASDKPSTTEFEPPQILKEGKYSKNSNFLYASIILT
jgi:hypothetical protein